MRSKSLRGKNYKNYIRLIHEPYKYHLIQSPNYIQYNITKRNIYNWIKTFNLRYR